MLELVAKIGLLFASPLTYIVIISLGFVFLDENKFGRTLFILLFTMIYNVWLKSIWKIPLPQPLEGWAFPSGHMHSAMVFWGWLAIEIRKFWFTSLVLLILSFAGYGLLWNVYHYPVDILGAIGFGSFSLFIYYIISKQPYFKEKPYRLGFFLLSLSLLVVGLICLQHAQKLHMWQALGTLIGFSLAWQQCSYRSVGRLSIRTKIIIILIATSSAVATTFLTSIYA